MFCGTCQLQQTIPSRAPSPTLPKTSPKAIQGREHEKQVPKSMLILTHNVSQIKGYLIITSKTEGGKKVTNTNR